MSLENDKDLLEKKIRIQREIEAKKLEFLKWEEEEKKKHREVQQYLHAVSLRNLQDRKSKKKEKKDSHPMELEAEKLYMMKADQRKSTKYSTASSFSDFDHSIYLSDIRFSEDEDNN